MTETIATSVLVISDTHGASTLSHAVNTSADVLIHCGDLTERSLLSEFRSTLDLIKSIDAPLKLIIAGNHDWSLDEQVFTEKLADFQAEDIEKSFGAFGEAKRLLQSDEAQAAGIVFLEEGVHHFDLTNGARLNVYASPYTPCKDAVVDGWGFQYDPDDEDHAWQLKKTDEIDVAITHGPPRGVLDDYIDDNDKRRRAGSSSLFTAIAHAQPMVHCFGHIHGSWGARDVAWRDALDDRASHLTAIDNEESQEIQSLRLLREGKFDSDEVRLEKSNARDRHATDWVCTANAPSNAGRTMFVNAAISSDDDDIEQLPWLINIDLKRSERESLGAGSNAKRRRGSDVAGFAPSKRVSRS